jgi:glycosyltransferase involved in cell wall biosynthesis
MNADSLEVSILIPCFNAQQWIGQCIESALAQTVTAKEVIVVDDGSSDDSLEIIKSFGNKIHFEAGPNRGGNFARNRLLELAQGEWVQFLDADDYLLPDKVDGQLRSAQAQTDVVYSPVIIETWNQDSVADQTPHGANDSQSLEEQWIRWHIAQTGSVLWRASSLRKIGGWNEEFPCCQDNEVTLRAIQNNLSFQFCPAAEAVYRIWSEETVCRKDPGKVVRFRTQLIREMLSWLESHGKLLPAHRDAAGQAFFEMARTLATTDISTASQYAKKCRTDRIFNVVGPAAPTIYRMLIPILGFARTEKIAALRR